MSTTYAELMLKVQDWSNRDGKQLPDSVVRDALDFAADKSYRKLRVPPLEFTREFTVEASDLLSTDNRVSIGLPELTMPVPSDLIDVVYMRVQRNSCVIEEKLDNRTYFQRTAEKSTTSYWTRVHNSFHIVSQGVTAGDVIDLHYYRRLPALDSSYGSVAANFNIQNNQEQILGTPVAYTGDFVGAAGSRTADGVLWFPAGTVVTNGAIDGALVTEVINELDVTPSYVIPNTVNLRLQPRDTEFTLAASTAVDAMDNPVDSEVVFDVPVSFTGMQASHWLRDENERILLYGALFQAFIYLEDDAAIGKYKELFEMEINELNVEENHRKYRGGNTRRNFNGRGLI